MKFTEKEEIIS